MPQQQQQQHRDDDGQLLSLASSVVNDNANNKANKHHRSSTSSPDIQEEEEDLLTTPLLHEQQGQNESSEFEIGEQHHHDTTSTNITSASSSCCEDMIRLLAMLSLVLVGLSVVLVIFLWPMLILLPIRLSDLRHHVSLQRQPERAIILECCGFQLLHLLALIYIEFPYLYIHRKLLLPIRILLMPLVNLIAKSEAIRENTPTWYNDCSKLLLDTTNDVDAFSSNHNNLSPFRKLLQSFKSSIRKDIRQKLRLFQNQGITIESIHSDYLSIRTDIPIIWEHECRTVAASSSNSSSSVLEEFVKRFLIVFMVPHAFLDRYMDAQTGKVVAIGLFVQTGSTTVTNFVYFCKATHSRCGIWQYHHLRGLYRAMRACSSASSLSSGSNMPAGDDTDNDDCDCNQLRYINFQVHQDYAKQLAGCQRAECTDVELMNQLYPISFYRQPSLFLQDLKIPLDEIEPSQQQNRNHRMKKRKSKKTKSDRKTIV